MELLEIITPQKKMNTQREKMDIESYALFLNVDETILKLNPEISDLGFQFVRCTMEEFEKKFSLMFLLEAGSKSKGIVTFEHNQKLTREFFEVLSKQPYGHQIAIKGEVFLLEQILTPSFDIEDKKMPIEQISSPMGETKKTARNILKTLRLCTTGDVAIAFDVLLSKKDRTPLGHSWSHKDFGINISTIDDAVLSEFKLLYPAEPTNLDYLRLAEDNYFLACETTKLKVKYVLLMTCLESLFNFGRDQIAHTISRHLSLILSNTVSEFNENYKNNKKLYQLRSSIVHGNPIKDDLNKKSVELASKTRKALVYCRNQHLKKEDLFTHLNSMGYS